MGKGYKKKRNKDHNNGSKSIKPRPEIGGTTTVNNNYIQNVIDRGNFRFECYYAVQGMHNHRYESKTDTGTDVSPLISCTTDTEKENERLLWRKYLGKILPASFRIGKDVPEYYKQTLNTELQSLLQKAQEYVPPLDDTSTAADDEDGTDMIKTKFPCDPRAGPLKDSATQIQKLSFCPHAYQLSGLDRATIRKNPALEELHVWLKQQVAAGTITRQETVSMIPPILLHVTSTDFVLDMCAAPGSKTSQMLEDLQCNVVQVPDHKSSNNTCTSTTTSSNMQQHQQQLGCLVANDASATRACMLVSQLRRILHMHPVALITAVNAQFFPADVVQFDKILCDVPCSGDGTTRKNINVWKTWTASGALALHSLQLSIAMKGAAELLKTNGTMVYSTCSLNPIENEAVVADLLRQSNGALELVEYQPNNRIGLNSTEEDNENNGPLLGFRTRPGLSSWKVLCEDTTQRQQKNREKKNNAKMRKKREAYAAASCDEMTPKEKTPSISVTETDLSMKNQGLDDVNVESSIPEGELVEDQTDRPTVHRFEPTSWDEAELLQVAKNEGLIHYTSIDEVPANLNRRIRKSAFSPSAEEVPQFHLERCIRCLPHDNNTGGFFVALLRKVSPWSANDRRHTSKERDTAAVAAHTTVTAIESSNTIQDDIIKVIAREAKKRPRNGDVDDDALKNHDEEETLREEVDDDDVIDDEALEGLDADNVPVRSSSRSKNSRGQSTGGVGGGDDFGKDDFSSVRDNIMDPLIEHYGLSNGFDKTMYMARACSESKVIYYVGKAVKQLFDLGIQKRITIVNTGLKGFMRNNRNVADCAVTYRVCQEGVHFLVPFMTKRKFIVGREDFRTCLLGEGKTIHLSKFSEGFHDQVKGESPGSFVVLLEGYEDELDQKLMVCMWKCRGESIDSLVAKVEADGLLGKLDAMKLSD